MKSFKNFIIEKYIKEKSFENTFTHNNQEYSLDKLKHLAKDLPVTKIKISELMWIFKYDNPKKDHPERIETADIENPIFVSDDKKRVVLDGLHRTEKALEAKRKTLPCKIIPADILEKCKIEKKEV